MKAIVKASALLVAGVIGSAASADKAHACSALIGGFTNSQWITWNDGGTWKCVTYVDKDKEKYFNKGTAIRYIVDMHWGDNCKVYKSIAGQTGWKYWFSPSAGSDTKTASQIGSNTNGIRLGC